MTDPCTDASTTDTSARRRVPTGLPGWVRAVLRFVRTTLIIFAKFVLAAWLVLAVYYSNLPWPWARFALAAALAAFAVWALCISNRRATRTVFAVVYVLVVFWWIMIPPSHHRPWRPEVAVLPRAIIDGDRVRMEGVRNFEFRDRDDFTERYETREFSLDHVTSLDLFVSYWAKGPVAHTFVSFNFDDGTPPLCISIETRPEVGEGFDPIASLFKQFELIYVVGDEHDLVGSRASHRDEEVFIYPLRTEPEGVRRLLRVYLERINEIYDRAEFYHLLKNNCTINIVRYANTAGRGGRFDFRHVFNGWIDRDLFAAGWVDTSIPFEELRRRAWITEIAKAAAHAPDFSSRIRASHTP